MANLTTRYAGLSISNPIIIASSGLTETVENIVELEASGAGAAVLKSIFEEEILMEMEQVKNQMTGRSLFFPETLDYLNNEPHEDLTRKYLTLIKECKKKVKIPIIASINCVSNQKWIYLANEIELAGADALELNVFSLPSGGVLSSQEIEDMHINIVENIVKSITIPVMVKISHYYTGLGNMIARFAKTGVKGIVLFNRYYLPDIDINSIDSNGAFVLSSPSDIALPLRWTALMSGKLPNMDFAATSGIHTGKDIVKTILAGASAVQIATTIYKNGAHVINEMNEFVLKWMNENGFNKINDFKGKLSYKNNSSSESWERVQFMKEFRHFVK